MKSKSSMILRSVVLLCIASIGVAVLVGRATRPGPNEALTIARPLDVESQSVVIETGSVEHRLRTMEAQLLELRIRVASLEAGHCDP
jgi:hypothetical protein